MDVETEHSNSFKNRTEVLKSEDCGCFYCVSLFRSGEVVEWWDDDNSGVGQTAVCPLCGMDSVLPVRPGIDQKFLDRMHTRYF
ncbi:MAG: hypothetical protein ACI97A_003449 [Planctomycetota bacterium]|jgi:hypothetical protein